ncbi:hypothetical protein [Kitasatospora cineracea]|uniref:hypothetical protein n=1 Tax=Kitasatospora cineracea TaxID=88074 RepID=UPI0036C92CB4
MLLRERLTLNAVVIVLAQSATTARLADFSRTRAVGWAAALMAGSIASGPRGRS